MMVRSEIWGLSLLASLGLIPVACGPSSEVGDGPTDMAGAGGSGVVGAAGQTSGATAPSDRHCESPQLDAESGIERCGNQEIFYHRPAAGPGCQFTTTASGGAGAGPADDEGYAGGAACNAASCPGKYPYCDSEEFDDAETCHTGCRVDADCGTNQICSCTGSDQPGTCLQADCRTDDDCGPGELCASTFQVCGPMEFHCTKPNDVCISGADCDGDTCAWGISDDASADAQVPGRYCESGICGRPFLVDSHARLAELAPRADWCDGALPEIALEQLSWPERRALSEHYARAARMEHASIAAFARFSLQLLNLGAPPELVEACTAAIGDETAHARLCFELASRYGGSAIGPAALSLEGCLDASSLLEIVELTIAEGCVGETLAALEAAEAAEHAGDPTVRSALLRIAADEKRHAELAFRFVRWVVTKEPGLLAHVKAAFAAYADRDSSSTEVTETTPRLLAHGLLSSAQKRAVRRAALEDVVVPCARALLCAVFEAPTPPAILQAS